MEKSRKHVPFDLFLKLHPNYKITESVVNIDVLDVTIIEGVGKKRPTLIENKDEIDRYIDAHSKASGKGSKSTIVTNVGWVSTGVSAVKTVVSATGVASLCAWMAGSYVSMKVSGAVKDQIITQTVKCRAFISHESVQHAYDKLKMLLECCDISHQGIYVDLLSQSYQASYISSSDSSRSLSEKLKSTNYYDIITELMLYLYEISSIDNSLYKNNGKRLFTAIVNLAFDIHFKVRVIKK